ncbi:MAG: aromatic amino acid lyase [Sphingosinicella sp.]|nr:aromatic amino acid lyase [Sphingosinicella sp.]
MLQDKLVSVGLPMRRRGNALCGKGGVRLFSWLLPLLVAGLILSPAADARVASPRSAPYQAITETMQARTVVLTGHDLTIEELIDIARNGAKVEVSSGARQRMADAYGLLLEGAAQGVSIYWFNRGTGGNRETVIFAGDPESRNNRELITRQQLAAFRSGARAGYGPEIADEEIVRAMMAVRANAMTHNAPSPELAAMLVDFINYRITPVVNARGTVGEGDLTALANIGAAMVGEGDVYLGGERMAAATALAKVGLKPLAPFGADANMLTSSNAYAAAQAALLVHDAKWALEWADLIYALDLNGMNSSVTPLASPVQADRPDKWLNWHAGKILAMLKGSYLFESDPNRIIQDSESLRASSIRQASAWKAWSSLRDSVLFQMNTSDHNPTVKVGVKPSDSWELSTPQLLRYYVKSSRRSGGKSGYILSNANWDPFPLANDIEAFSIALANMNVAVLHRMQRFGNPFFTGVAAADVLPTDVRYGLGGYAPIDIWQEIQSLAAPIAAEGNAGVNGVEELQAQTRLKVNRARQIVDLTIDLLGFDLNIAARWIDVRRAQVPTRRFGEVSEGLWSEFRKRVPLGGDLPGGIPQTPNGAVIAEFLRTTSPETYFGALPEPAGERVARVR